ncbi:hypothetical protein GZ77_10125 [Endozoicomonas montiporae]|uniref:Uncharacterized protein n=2 Tax=Endozoicomonas montiporae TaxID=1027273 RepID=A0A081N889_9GAMM|nr:hypothetical protein [Endozoicomonas montiporae]AMO55451.1 hypothetical protein EZMO1_1258 [Endozoicomonas montiporae CL-33]KEQ14662.1 hypothetical protein GZ77_10125 [Endozoicomonas montiporae]
MASRIRLVDITKLSKSSFLVQQESEAVLSQASQSLKQQAQFIENVGLDRKALRDFINSDRWTVKQRHKARQELVRFSEELKQGMSEEASEKRREIRVASNLLKPKSKSKSTVRRRRTGFV